MKSLPTQRSVHLVVRAHLGQRVVLLVVIGVVESKCTTRIATVFDGHRNLSMATLTFENLICLIFTRECWKVSTLFRRLFRPSDARRATSTDVVAPEGVIDESRADFVFCRRLAEQRKTDSEIDAAMRSSHLMRPKWDEKRGAQTYGERTIAAAMKGIVTHAAPQKRLIMNNASTVKPEAISWLWKNKIPAGKLTLFVGQPGLASRSLRWTLCSCKLR